MTSQGINEDILSSQRHPHLSKAESLATYEENTLIMVNGKAWWETVGGGLSSQWVRAPTHNTSRKELKSRRADRDLTCDSLTAQLSPSSHCPLILFDVLVIY